MSKTHKLLGKLEEVADGLVDAARAAHYSLDDAEYEYERLSCADDFLGKQDSGEFLREDMGDAVDAASEYTQEVIARIREFDKAFAQLVLLRGKLAEEIGIPLMSQLGTEPFGRYDEEYSL